MSDILVTRSRGWTWKGRPGETITGLAMTGWPDELDGETVSFSIDGHEFDTPVSGTITDGEVTFPTFVLPDVEGTYVTRLDFDDDEFARGRLLLRDAGESSFTDTTFPVEVLGITFELDVTIRGATTAQVEAIEEAQASADDAQDAADAAASALASHTAATPARHAAPAISLNAEGVEASDVEGGIEELAAFDLTLLTPQTSPSICRDSNTVPGLDLATRRSFRGAPAAAATGGTGALALFTTPVRVPANVLTYGTEGTARCLYVVTISGRTTQNNATPRTATFVLTVGGITFSFDVFSGITNTPTTRGWRCRAELHFLTLFGFQVVNAEADMIYDGQTARSVAVAASTAVNVAAPVDASMTVQHSLAAMSSVVLTNHAEIYDMDPP